MSTVIEEYNRQIADTPSDIDLPEGWEATTMGQVAVVIGGGTPSTSDPTNFSENGHPWITPADLSGFNEIWIKHGKRGLTDKGLKASSATMMPKGTVLMSSRAPIGYVAVAANPISTNQGFKSFVLPPGVIPEYCYYWLKYMKPRLEQMGSGSTFLEISGSRAREIPFHLAPTKEQKRIAAKIEELLAQVSVARARLTKISRILKRFRQAVLAAACSGNLTEEWRAVHPKLEPAKDLLRKIEHERNKHQGLAYRTSQPVLTTETNSDLSDLPDLWCWTTINHVADVRGGIQKQPKRAPKRNAYPYLRVANVLRGKLDLAEMHKMELFEGELETYRLQPDDLLVVEGNGSLSEIGRSALWNGEIENCVHQNHIIRVRARICSSPYLNAYWNSPIGTARIADVAVTTAGLYNLSTQKVGRMPVPLPPLEEQHEIVRRVEALFNLAGSIEKSLEKATKRADKVTQAILAKAFRGELVPTEAELARREGRNFEPASVLLESIRTQNQTSQGRISSSRRRKGIDKSKNRS